MSNGGSASDPVLTESLLSTGIVTDFGSNPEDPSPSASPNWTPEAEDKERDRDRSFDDSIVSKGLLRNTDNETVVNSMRRNVKRVRDIIQDPDMDSRLEKLFKLHQRGTTWQMEVYCGVIQFISCVYVLPVVPLQLGAAGFQIGDMISITALACGVGSLIAGIFTNLPFIIAPPTAVSIFYSVFIQQNSFDRNQASICLIIVGVLLMLFGYRPFGSLVTRLIPRAIQAGTAVGIGLITALAGSTEIDLVKPGKYTIVDIGKITDQVVIAMFGVVIIAVGLHYHVKGTFCVVLLFNTFVWWLHTNEWPEGVATEPSFEIASFANAADNRKTGGLLIAELWFLCVLTLSGLVRSMSDLSQLTRDDGTVPRNRWIFIMCGAMTAFSGALCGPPILISPESAGGIKAGAKTGLSTAVCGLLFCLSTFFTPIFKAVPEAATSPLLIAVGVILCQNATKVDWKDGRKAFPAFCCLFFIPFTYNILFGVVLGYTVYVCVGIFTGDLYRDALELKRDLFDDGKIVGVRGHLAMSMDQRDPNITIRLH